MQQRDTKGRFLPSGKPHKHGHEHGTARVKGNYPNIPPITTHERAVALGRKGGLARSKKKTMAKIINCTEKCPNYCDCPVRSAAMLERYGGKCIIKTSPPEVQALFINAFERGLEGGLAEITKSFFSAVLKARSEGTLAAYKEAFEMSIQYVEALYGSADRRGSAGAKVTWEIWETREPKKEIKKAEPLKIDDKKMLGGDWNGISEGA